MKWNELKGSYESRVAKAARLSPHELLGVARNVSAVELKAAYLRLVNTYHPDKADPFMARHNAEMMKLINAAYDQLKLTAR
jgi:DnaJ-class molecular chaperone